MRARARAWRVRVRVYKLSRIIPYVMENKVGLYRMLIDASCAISQNLSALTPLMGVDALNSARKSLREIIEKACVKLDDAYSEIVSDNK